MVKRSTLSNNTNAGLLVEGPGGGGRASIDDSSIVSNGTGIIRLPGGQVRLSNNDIAHNTTAKTGSGLFSFGNNRLSSNGADGDAFIAETQQ